MTLELMTDFFAARVDTYDEHMLNNVKGCREGYIKMAEVLKKLSKKYTYPLRILDLGCGTGLELDEIFKLIPQAVVTGVDITAQMLQKLKEKYPDKDLTLICGNYFDVGFGKEHFDCVISFQTMHHFTAQKKMELYHKIYDALTSCGVYIECDYMVENQAEEDFYFNENRRLCRELKLREDELYHYDMPLTVEHQKRLLYEVGFSEIETVFKQENTTMLVVNKVMEAD